MSNPGVEDTREQLIKDVLEAQGVWARGRVDQVARVYGVDADDLWQETLVSLLRAGNIDAGRKGVRTFLARRIEWTALDIRRRGAGHEVAASPSSLQELEEVTDRSSAANPAVQEGDAVDADMLHRVGLTENQAQILALLSSSAVDLQMHEFARLVQRSYGAVRKDRTRGLRKLEELFGLTPTERTCLVSYRRWGSISRAAEEMDVSEETARCQLRHAREKINRIFLVIVTGTSPDNDSGAAPEPSGCARLHQADRTAATWNRLICKHSGADTP